MIYERSTDNFVFVSDVFNYVKRVFPQMHKWLIGTFGKDYDSFVAVKVYDEDDDTTLLFWTAEYVFHLTVNAMPPVRGRLRNTRRRGYLGLARTARMAEVGEEHLRGADMYDGDYSEKSWNEVVRDIFRHAILSTRPPIFESRRKPKRTTKPRVKLVGYRLGKPIPIKKKAT